MDILLTGLKIIGLLLLVLLLLVLLILVMILYWPVRYKLRGMRDAADWNVGGEICWLFVKLTAGIGKDRERVFRITVFGHPVYPAAEKKVQKSAPRNKKRRKIKPEAARSGETEADIVQPEEQETESLASEKVKPVPEKSTVPVQEEIHEKDRKKEKKKCGFSAARKKIETFQKKAEKIPAAISEKCRALKKKESHIRQFLDKPYTRNTIRRGKKIIYLFFRSVRPKKSEGYLHFGMGDPADTGEMLGRISMFYFLFSGWFILDPDFEKKTAEGYINMKGRLCLGTIGIPALSLILSKDFKRTKALAEKI